MFSVPFSSASQGYAGSAYLSYTTEENHFQFLLKDLPACDGLIVEHIAWVRRISVPFVHVRCTLQHNSVVKRLADM